MIDPVSSPETEPCAVCDVGTARRVRAERPYPVGRWSVRIQDEFYRCDRCGEEYNTPEQSEAAERQAVEHAHEERGLLLPREIRALGERLGLTQREFEALLGVGTNSVVRWENGYVWPNAATNALLRLLASDAATCGGWPSGTECRCRTPRR